MKPLTRSLSVAAAAAALTAAVMFALHRREQAQIHQLRSANDEMMFEIALRSKPASEAPPATSTASGARPLSSTPAALAPPTALAYRDAGQATPLATLQTIAWACDRGDTSRLATMLHLEPAAREKTEAYMRTLSPETRGQWTSAEEMAAAILATESIHQPFPEKDILDRATEVQLEADRVILRLPGTLKDRTEYQRVAGSWKYVVTERLVNAYLQLTADQASGP